MDQKIQSGQSPQFLQHLLTNPAAASVADRQQLEMLVQTYPQCSVFHMLLATATQNSDAATAAKTLHLAAVHTANRDVLFRLMHQPEFFVSPPQKQFYQRKQFSETSEFLAPDTPFTEEKLADEDVIILPESIQPETADTSFSDEKVADIDSVPAVEITQPEIIDTSFIEEKPAANEYPVSGEKPQPETTDASFTDKKVADAPTISEEELNEETIAAENDLRVEDVNESFVNVPAEEIIFQDEIQTIQQQAAETETSKPLDTSFSAIDEEVYDEITAIEDIHFEVVKTVSPEEKPVAAPEVPAEQSAFSMQDKAEKDMLSNIASIDYFTFNNRFGQKQKTADPAETVPESKETEVIPTETADLSAEKEPETVSKYHDDKMPYTFMWWLDKTRKEYAGTYQPYVKLPQTQQHEPKLSVGPELHQQYIESIFHAQPPHGLAEVKLQPAIEAPVKRKEDQLIERFIIEEPHIHPPSSEKLDTENKAKKSSEDADVLVTETLAKIYLDQMLYHKALDTYKKLVLKFPEKSRYFTAQIELIEKKIN